MFHSFEWVMLGNSVLWGVTAMVIFSVITRRRVEPVANP